MSEWSQPSGQKRLMLAVGVFAASFLFGWNMFLAPKAGQLKSTRLELTSERQKKEVWDRLAAVSAELSRFDKTLSETREVGWLISAVNEMAEASGVRLDSVQPQDVQTIGDYEKIAVQLEARGGYHQIGRFVSKIESAQRFIRIQELSVEKDAAAGLKASLLLAVYHRPKGA